MVCVDEEGWKSER